MKRETASRLAFIPVALGFACFGCALMNPPDASVIVLDKQTGAPVVGAGSGLQYWTNFKPSNAKGRLYLRKHQTYIHKEGYRTYSIQVEPRIWKKEIFMTPLEEGETASPYPYFAPITEETPNATNEVD